MRTPDDRMTALEMALAHQQAAIDDLSDVVRRQSDEIARLQRQIVQLAERLASAETGDGETVPADVRPPHW